jgi:hypothetical protein
VPRVTAVDALELVGNPIDFTHGERRGGVGEE